MKSISFFFCKLKAFALDSFIGLKARYFYAYRVKANALLIFK